MTVDHLPPDQSSEFLGVNAVSLWTGIPQGTLRYWRHQGDGQGPPSTKFGRRIVYRTSEVREWIEEQFKSSATG